MTMNNILLTVSYDGTDFCGWQRQDKADYGNPVRTVQGEIEAALEKMLKVPVKLYGSGRTDSGVHAMGQCANFYSPSDKIPPENYIRALNGLLPPDIRIMEARGVDEKFNSRFNATSRVYRYFIQTVKPSLASESRYRWYLHYRPDIEVLNSMCSHLRGEIDCATFAAAGDKSLSTSRYIDDAFFYWDRVNPDLLVFQIEASSFLWKMVRSLTGTLIQSEQKGKDSAYFKSILESCDRKNAGVTAPPTGLFLYQIKFDGIRRHV